jgi:hypothetical protein
MRANYCALPQYGNYSSKSPGLGVCKLKPGSPASTERMGVRCAACFRQAFPQTLFATVHEAVQQGVLQIGFVEGRVAFW